MSDRTEDAKQDIAFLRALIEDSGPTMAFDGAVLAAVGVTFGFVGLFYWLVSAEMLNVPPFVEPWAWVAGVLVVSPVILLLRKRFPTPSGAAARAVLAAWTGVATGIAVAVLAFVLGAWRLGLPAFVVWTFPVVLFTLYGTAWSVAYSVMRRVAFAFIAGGCFAAAVASGFFMGRPEEWLVLSLGLFLLVAVPGFAIMRQARRA